MLNNSIKNIFNNFYKFAIRQNKILKNRIRLIRGMQKALNIIKDPNFKNIFERIISDIRKDSFNHFLSLSPEDSKIVTYTKSDKTKFDEKKRIKTTLGKYIRRNFPNLDYYSEQPLPKGRGFERSLSSPD